MAHEAMSSVTRPSPPGPEMQAALRAQVEKNIARMKRIGAIRPNELVVRYEQFLEMADVAKRPTGPGNLLDLFG